MSEPFPKPRALPGSVELRGREGGDGARPDPLAELARLVGREDPFRDLFPARDGRAGTRRPAQPAPQADPFVGGSPPLHADDEDRVFHAPLGQDRRDPFRLPAPPSPSDYVDAVDPDHPLEAGGPPPLNADLWAQGLPEPAPAEPLGYAPTEDEDSPAGHSTKRTLVVLAAVLALTAGGIGATFLVRNGGGKTASGEPPTIMADVGPIKIQPPDTSNQSTGGDGNTALIEKSASDNVNNAKVVDTQEQPVDLNQLPKAPPASPAQQADDGRVAVASAPAGTNVNAFPQPRKVKTILIRPDGSVIGEGAAPGSGATEGAAATPVASPAATGGARPATPKSTARATATPKSASSTADGVAAVKPKPVKPAPKPKPVQAADAGADATASTAPAAATPAPTAATGTFSVQLAAPATEQEAKDVSSRLQKKFASELDGHSPGIFKAEKGGKDVYRVRVSNMTQDDAKGLCSKLQAGGGSCFVVRN